MDRFIDKAQDLMQLFISEKCPKRFYFDNIWLLKAINTGMKNGSDERGE